MITKLCTCGQIKEIPNGIIEWDEIRHGWKKFNSYFGDWDFYHDRHICGQNDTVNVDQASKLFGIHKDYILYWEKQGYLPTQNASDGWGPQTFKSVKELIQKFVISIPPSRRM